MLQKCLSTLFHLVGIHEWEKGKFVDIFHAKVDQQAVFLDNAFICNVEMDQHLKCSHNLLDETEHVVLDKNGYVYKLLVEELCSNNRVKEIKRAASITSTSIVESFHSLGISNYRPKRYH